MGGMCEELVLVEAAVAADFDFNVRQRPSGPDLPGLAGLKQRVRCGRANRAGGTFL